MCKCVLYYCHGVSTQLQLTNISISICLQGCISVIQCSKGILVCAIFKQMPIYIQNAFAEQVTLSRVVCTQVSRRMAKNLYWPTVAQNTRTDIMNLLSDGFISSDNSKITQWHIKIFFSIEIILNMRNLFMKTHRNTMHV